MGSTAEIVLRTAQCATLLVRAPHQPETGK
jgi:nucleotide-binding universal stress UspA family protein